MIYPELVYKIRGIVFDIFNNVVENWNEDVFENILTDALRDNDFSVEQQKEFEVIFKENRVGLYRTDLIVDYKIIIGKEILETLGPGYFHQIYRRAYWDELHPVSPSSRANPRR